MISDLARNAFDWCLRTEGSSRSSALIRIGLVPILWSRWAGELLLFQNLSPAYGLLVVCFFGSTTLMLVGLFSRLSSLWAGLTTLSMYYYFGLELGREPWTHHHTYVLAVGTFLCALTPCGRSLSLDRWLALRRCERTGDPPPPERGNLWGLRLIALQLSVIYLFTAYDKTTVAFLSGERMEGILLRYYLGSDMPRWTGFHELMIVVSVGIVVLEYALGIGLLFARTRRWLVIPGLAMHAAFYVLLPVLTYSATMFVLYLAYFDADRVHETIHRLLFSTAGRIGQHAEGT